MTAAANRPAGNLAAWLSGLAQDPDVFLHQIDVVNRRALLVRIGATRIGAAAFLDERVLGGDETGAWVPLRAAVDALPPDTGPAGIILHCGHAGSTLVARLLGELPGAWILREPLALQPLAAEARLAGTPHARLEPSELDATLALTQAAFAKTPPGRGTAIVKHTSFTANLAPALLRRRPATAVLCLWIPLADYLAVMLRDAGLREGLRQAAGCWIYDIAARLGAATPALAALADAELAALNWTAARLAFAQAAAQPGARVLSWDFERFLAEPDDHLLRLARHFGLDVGRRTVDAALASPWRTRYAKDPRYPFDAAVRRREIAEARRRLGDEIAAGEAFAAGLAARLEAAGSDTGGL